VLEDVRRFARRRPGAFLLAAGATGFAFGRAVRAGAMSSHSSESPAMRGYGSNGLYSSYGSGTSDFGMTGDVDYQTTTALIIEPDDTLPPPTTGTRPESQMP